MAEKAQTTHDAEARRDGSESPHFDEKGDLQTVDAGLSADQVVAEYDEKETQRIMRKIDYRLIPLLAVLYL